MYYKMTDNVLHKEQQFETC